MNKQIKKLTIVSLMLFVLSSCQGMLDSSALKSGGTGFIAGKTAQKAIDKLESIREFTPELKIYPKEVCWRSSEKPDKMRCELTLCKRSSGDCVRYININSAISAVDNRTAMIISIKSLARADKAAVAFCKREEITCKKFYETYKDIDKIFLIED